MQPSPDEKKIMSRYFIDWLVHDVMNGVHSEDVLRVVTNKKKPFQKQLHADIYLKGQKLDDDTAAIIFKEARMFKNSALWNYLLSDVYYQSMKKMDIARTEDDLYSAKVMKWFTREMSRALDKFIIE